MGKVPAPNLGPAGTITVKVDTTPGGTIALKGVSKVFGGVISVGQMTYDIYTDYETFGLSKNFVKAAGADIGLVVGISVVGGVVASAEISVYAIALVGGGIAYAVNRCCISPWKETLK